VIFAKPYILAEGRRIADEFDCCGRPPHQLVLGSYSGMPKEADRGESAQCRGEPQVSEETSRNRDEKIPEPFQQLTRPAACSRARHFYMKNSSVESVLTIDYQPNQ
jgi:hypothetical protein